MYDTSVALGDRQPLSHVALPPQALTVTHGGKSILSRNKVFSRSRYYDIPLVLTLDHISLGFWDSVYLIC